MLIRKFDQYVGRSVEEGASLALNALVVQGPESHGEYMSEGKIKPSVFDPPCTSILLMLMIIVFKKRPSDLVTSGKGANLQKKMWAETEDVLKRYAPATATGELGDIFQA